MKEKTAWAIKCAYDNLSEGYQEHIECDWKRKEATRTGLPWLIFRTRAEARAYREDRYGYLRDRPDLKLEPFGWKMPKVIKVIVSIKECTDA